MLTQLSPSTWLALRATCQNKCCPPFTTSPPAPADVFISLCLFAPAPALKRFDLSADERGNGKYTDTGGYERVKVCWWDRSIHASSWPPADLPCWTAAVFEVPLCSSHFAQGLFLTILLRRIICCVEFFGINRPDSSAARIQLNPDTSPRLQRYTTGKATATAVKKYTPALQKHGQMEGDRLMLQYPDEKWGVVCSQPMGIYTYTHF